MKAPERSKQLPEDWQFKRLSSLANSYAGGTPDRSKPEYFHGDIPWVKSGEVNLRKIMQTEERISELALSESAAKIAESGSVLVAMYGATAGKVARLKIDAAINQAVLSIRTIGDELDNDFLFWVIESSAEKLLSMCQGAAQPNLSKGLIDGLEIATPPLPEQKKIAAILTMVDDKLDVIDRQIEAMQTIKLGLMQTLFSRGVGTQDATGRWVPRTEFKDSVLGAIPDEWQVVQIQAISEVIRGASPRPQGDPRYYGGDVPRLMGADVTRDGKWVTPKIDSLTEEGAKLSRPCPKGTLTIICSGDVGVPSFLAVDACIHDGFLALINIDESLANKDYLYHIIYSVKQRFYTSATHGGVFTNLTTGILKEFLVPLPTLVEQQKIASILDVADEKISAAFRKREYNESLKRGLMQKLLTGEWRVKLDNPSSAV
ncbi:UNVERIFIED_ORG: type I restriction enzyme S subunit [Pseudomonas mohnii]|nr:type I restriction enzyme S subunit [Pseudomonas mohnii]